MAERVRATIERDGDRLEDLQSRRLGPGHLGAILSVVTTKPRDAKPITGACSATSVTSSHVTVEVQQT